MWAWCGDCKHFQRVSANVPRGECDYCDRCGGTVTVGRDYLAMTVGAIVTTFLSVAVIVVAVYFGRTVAKRAGLT